MSREAAPTRRRGFASSSLLMVILVAGGCSQSSAPVDATATLAALAKKYGIQIVTRDVQPADHRIHATPCTPGELGRYAGLFAEEFGLYPPDVIRRAQLERGVLCKDLSYGGQLRGAIPDFESKTLYLDAVRGDSNPTYQRKVIHHDFFHMIDYRDDGNLYTDKEWEKLNPAGFHYGTGGANSQDDPMSSVLTDRWPGFLNSYSKTGVEEDKAEMYANLVVEPAYVERRAQTDAVVRAKVAAIKRLMVRFSPDADDHFWARAAALR
ncbi:MAG TPA: hypothetical protein VFG04_16370 [Planctomycetaceae bacterium]|nr:hypothetical protein [Planctomycetaceae bacterium]